MSTDTRPTEEIIADALSREDENEQWDMITTLHFRGTRDVFEAARELTKSVRPVERRVGVDILAQLGSPERSFPDEIRDILVNLLNGEEDEQVLRSVCVAFTHNTDFKVVKPLVALRAHPNADIRYAVVIGLLWQEDEAAVQALIELSADSDEDVRNWATFGLGSMIGLDTPAVRETLFQRLNDESDAVRGEALRGLTERQDERAIEPLIRELEIIAEAEEWWDYAFEAARNMPDSRLYPALLAARESGIEDVMLNQAIALCRIPTPEEGEDKPTDAKGTCSVCWRRRAFRESDFWQFCKRCGWYNDPDQRANPDLAEGFNRRSLNKERERWRMRLEAGKMQEIIE